MRGRELNSFDSNYEACGYIINRGCTNTGATTFFILASNICGSIVRNLLKNSAVASRFLGKILYPCGVYKMREFLTE